MKALAFGLRCVSWAGFFHVAHDYGWVPASFVGVAILLTLLAQQVEGAS